ncbi:hypothetical protein HDU76_003408 [Blyttiomyces sp. JEL0837]|nr:hypothetical protein HDU76_003408 [Blyttiomyces sp. JEL0837]
MKGLHGLGKGKNVDGEGNGGDEGDGFDDVSVASDETKGDDSHPHHHGFDVIGGEDGKNGKKNGGNGKHKIPVGAGGRPFGGMSSDISDGTGDRTVKEEGHKRKAQYIAPVIVTLALMVAIFIFGLMARGLIIDSIIDNTWYRMAFLSLIPMNWLFFQFVPQAALASLFQIFGPINQMTENSTFYSGKAPKRRGVMGNGAPLPHITVQIPVYLESLDGVIDPTIRSVQTAITTYEMQGGSANIFVNDDGMQILSNKEATKRQNYYAFHNIGWASRPKHNHNGFTRRGRFKKASNMNYCLHAALRVEKLMESNSNLSPTEALDIVITEDEGLTWAAGDLRIGDLILIVDSDTRVPEDCFMDAAMEMAESPEVAILQHSAGPMLVVFNYWERGIAFFTEIIYLAIRYWCAGGEVAPFVGHNSFLRWSAIKEVAFEEDGVTKFWSESHVSEDFDMALRLQIDGYVVRYASYCGDGFKEGVSLTVYDEFKRWQKYSYGCSELMFNPFKFWLTRGPFTKLFRTFVTSNMPPTSKISIIAYMGTYYAIAAAWILALTNYVVMGFFDDILDHAYLDSWKVLAVTLLVFNFIVLVSYSTLKYRLKEDTLVRAAGRILFWTPFFAVFFSGLSFHCSVALLAHLFGYDMKWGATSKELENSNFFKEEWAVANWSIIVPTALIFGGHILAPIALNPFLMTFSF